MAGRFKFITFAVAMGLCAGAYAAGPPTVTEHFDSNTDGTWQHSGNTSSGQNYGWQNANTAGGSPGELGGVILRSNTPNFYGFNIGSVDPATNVLTASGTYHLQSHGGSSGILLGFFQGISSYANVANHDGNPKNFIGSYIIDGNDPWLYLWDPGGFQDRAEIAGGTFGEPITVPFSMTWDPSLGSKGRLTATFGGFGPSSVDYSGDPTGAMTHFGIMAPGVSGGSDVFAFDDVSFSSNNPIPEPAILGLLSVAGLMLIRRRRAA
jgi:hypothetical protein